MFRKLFCKPAFFINSVSRVQKLRNGIVAENGLDLFGGQRFFGVIAFSNLIGGGGQVAQETPGVAASSSGAFVKEDHVLNAEFGRMNDERSHSAFILLNS